MTGRRPVPSLEQDTALPEEPIVLVGKNCRLPSFSFCRSFNGNIPHVNRSNALFFRSTSKNARTLQTTMVLHEMFQVLQVEGFSYTPSSRRVREETYGLLPLLQSSLQMEVQHASAHLDQTQGSSNASMTEELWLFVTISIEFCSLFRSSQNRR